MASTRTPFKYREIADHRRDGSGPQPADLKALDDGAFDRNLLTERDERGLNRLEVQLPGQAGVDDAGNRAGVDQQIEPGDRSDGSLRDDQMLLNELEGHARPGLGRNWWLAQQERRSDDERTRGPKSHDYPLCVERTDGESGRGLSKVLWEP